MRLTSLFLSLLVFISIFILSGCTAVSPKETLSNALKKNFDANGYNYSSKTRFTNLVFSNENNMSDEQTSTKILSNIYLAKGIDVIKGLSIGADGAIDYGENIRSEVTYDFKYDRDNVMISFRFPFLFDYSTKTLYIGTTFLNTIFPMKEENIGKLVRIDFNDEDLQSLLSNETIKSFDDQNVRNLNDAFKKGTVQSINDLNASLFTFKTPTDRVSDRTVHVELDHNQSVKFVMTILDALIQQMYTDKIITKDVYGTYMIATDKDRFNQLTEAFTMRLAFDFDIDSNGYIVLVCSQINISDKDKKFELGMENTTSMFHFNKPVFTLHPVETGSIDYMEVFKSWKEFFPPKEDDPFFEPILDEQNNDENGSIY